MKCGLHSVCISVNRTPSSQGASSRLGFLWFLAVAPLHSAASGACVPVCLHSCGLTFCVSSWFMPCTLCNRMREAIGLLTVHACPPLNRVHEFCVCVLTVAALHFGHRRQRGIWQVRDPFPKLSISSPKLAKFCNFGGLEGRDPFVGFYFMHSFLGVHTLLFGLWVHSFGGIACIESLSQFWLSCVYAYPWPLGFAFSAACIVQWLHKAGLRTHFLGKCCCVCDGWPSCRVPS